MANQGIYREASAVGGLPLPRAQLLPLTLAVVLLALAAIGMSPTLLVLPGQSAAGAWRLFRDGGAPMWLLLLLDIAAPVAIGGLGVFVLRGKRVPAGLLFVVAGLPFAVALLGAWWGQRMVLGAISGESVDPEQKARILAEGLAESMSNDIFGGFVVCGAALAAVAAAASAVASIDAATATRDGPKPSSSGAIGAGAAGAAWVVTTIALGAVRLRAAGGLVLLDVLPVLVAVIFAILAGRKAAVLRGWHDRAEASRAAGALVVAALTALLAVLALQRAIESSFAAKALGAISGESVDPSQQATILVYALDAGRLAPLAYALHAVLGAATFGLALAPALGNARNPATPSVVIAAVFGLALVGGALALARARGSAPRAMIAYAADSTPAGVSLPVVVEAFSRRGSGSSWGTHVILRNDGTGEGSVDPSCTGAQKLTVYADRAATVAMLRARLGAPRATPCPRSLTFVARRTHPPELDARLGDLAGYLGTTAYFEAKMDDEEAPSGDSPAHNGVMRVTSVADDAIEIDGVRVRLPLTPGTAPERRGPSTSRIRYVFRPSDTMAHVIETIASVEGAYQSDLRTWDLERVIDDGARPPPPPPPTPGSAALSVNGRLPPEVIERIVRQSMGRMRLCYENGLRSKPTLHGRVMVKFVIGRDGTVTTATDGGSDLPDRGVVACVVRAFERLTFPQPEGGIVTVVYPLVFQQG